MKSHGKDFRLAFGSDISWNGQRTCQKLGYLASHEGRSFFECHFLHREIWEKTNNTVGFNHMVASGNDASAYQSSKSSQYAALAMETMYHYTAYFADNDPR